MFTFWTEENKFSLLVNLKYFAAFCLCFEIKKTSCDTTKVYKRIAFDNI